MIVKRLNKDFSLLDDTLIAHKGIYGYSNKLKRKVEPNTYESCKFAIDNNIPFECDIRNTLDNVPVLAHDNTLAVIAKKKIKVNKYTYVELCQILKEKAPSKLEDVLKYNNGKVGVVVDAKEAHIFYSKYREKLSNILNKYSSKGEIILQSFNPFFMLSLRKRINNILTCQLICRGKTILDSFKAPKSFAYIYERIISIICFIARTDAINMENHSNSIWQKRTRLFISKKANTKVELKMKKLLEEVDKSLSKEKRKFNNFLDKVQLKLVKIANELTKKPVLAFTIEKDDDYNKMENLYIVSYIVDFSKDGVEEYIKKIKMKK